ncbi:TPA: Hsp20/alpha crystallin family protein [Candidatus Bathyarchaeota archaeon]|nr:Hsp20/alpha crystallin family protein [Candidatus Bathyarchaeota archaeon]
MVRCEICGRDGAYFICAKCGSSVCSQCYDSELGLCKSCSNISVKKHPLLFGDTLLLGVFLIMLGMFVIATASLISSEGGGIIIVPPFFIGTLKGTSVLTAIVLIISLIILFLMFLPWILEMNRSFRKSDISDQENVILSGQEYIITLRIPDCREENVEVEAFNGRLTIRAYRNNRLIFERSYNLPHGSNASGIRYRCENGFLVVRVTLDRKGF